MPPSLSALSERAMRFLRLALIQATALIAVPAFAQMKADLPADVVRHADNQTYLDDLVVNDTALIYPGSVCLDNGGLFVPGWTTPADLASTTYQASGVIMRIEVLPGKKLKGTLVDAAQAQEVAKGHSNAPRVLLQSDYNQAVIHYFLSLIYTGGEFGVKPCEQERRENPLRTLNLFSLESVNGFTLRKRGPTLSLG
jgi:hypothetical protein